MGEPELQAVARYSLGLCKSPGAFVEVGLDHAYIAVCLSECCSVWIMLSKRTKKEFPHWRTKRGC